MQSKISRRILGLLAFVCSIAIGMIVYVVSYAIFASLMIGLLGSVVFAIMSLGAKFWQRQQSENPIALHLEQQNLLKLNELRKERWENLRTNIFEILAGREDNINIAVVGLPSIQVFKLQFSDLQHARKNPYYYEEAKDHEPELFAKAEKIESEVSKLNNDIDSWKVGTERAIRNQLTQFFNKQKSPVRLIDEYDSVSRNVVFFDYLKMLFIDEWTYVVESSKLRGDSLDSALTKLPDYVASIKVMSALPDKPEIIEEYTINGVVMWRLPQELCKATLDEAKRIRKSIDLIDPLVQLGQRKTELEREISGVRSHADQICKMILAQRYTRMCKNCPSIE